MYNEPILHSSQLLSGAGGGILQAMLASIVTIPVVDDDTFVIKGRSGDGTYVTETWTFKSSRAAAFQVAIGADAAAAQTNLIAAIVADSQLWSAVATTQLGRFFAAAYATQFMIYRKSPPSGSPNEDRIYGAQTTATGIKVVSFTEGGYTTAFSTEANIPATDPGAKRFGFGRVAGPNEGAHWANGRLYTWDPACSKWTTPDTTLNLAGGDMSSSLTSPPISLNGCRHLSITLHADSATHVGTVAVQTSDDGSNWNAETLSSTPTAASGSAFDARIELETSAAYARVVYTASSGAGTLTGTYTLKE
jgi:hypothetical protein